MFPASHAANLQRLTYLLVRKAVEQRISKMVSQYDILQEKMEDALDEWLDALERGDIWRAELQAERLRRALSNGWAVLPQQEMQEIRDIAELMGQTGALAADLPILMLDKPDLTLPQIINGKTAEILPGAKAAAGVYFAIGQEVRDAVTQHVYKDGLNLSGRLHVRLAEQQDAFNRIIAEGLQNGRASVRLGQELARLNVTDPRFPRYLDDLVQAVRKGDIPAREKAFANAFKQAAKRKQGPLGVKDAVDRLLEAVQKGNAKAMDKAIDAFMQHKARYHAIVIARTEGAEAFREGFVKRAEERPDLIKGIKWNLSGSHPRKDICDVYATQDLYGLGPGVYPPSELPRDHPNGLCWFSSVLTEAAQEQAT